MDSTVRNILIYGFGSVGIAVGTYFLVYSIKKRQYQKRNVREGGSPDTTITDSSADYNPKPDADYLKSKLHGYGLFTATYKEVADRLQRLSDSKLVKLSNYYNSKGYKEDGRTLIQELEHEDDWLECNFSYCYEPIIKRMKNLGLR